MNYTSGKFTIPETKLARWSVTRWAVARFWNQIQQVRQHGRRDRPLTEASVQTVARANGCECAGQFPSGSVSAESQSAPESGPDLVQVGGMDCRAEGTIVGS